MYGGRSVWSASGLKLTEVDRKLTEVGLKFTEVGLYGA